MSVIDTAPVVFSLTAQACPDRHIEAASLLGADVSDVTKEDAGKVLVDALLSIMHKMQV